ncbi:4Fe-4S dicluster domain-containing protein [Geomonas agri]|uniref:4Fe-4S dicluster domain-containing protein n=1 Tax=Geomonas agri TaxID=2873702 RepID=UPI001CD5CB38|nr:4Fe-4S binding protein [Geomonas agri]
MTKTREPDIDATRCTGCGRCVAACPGRLLTLEVVGYRKYALLVRPRYCDGCLACVAACPVRAIS